MKVKLSDIIDAIDFTDRNSEYFLDKETGEIVYINLMVMTCSECDEAYDRLDEHGFYRLPTSFDINDYGLMEEFTAGLPERPRAMPSSAIRGRGAFSRFKDGVRRLGLEQAWCDFQDDAHRRVAIRWCEENGIEYEE